LPVELWRTPADCLSQDWQHHAQSLGRREIPRPTRRRARVEPGAPDVDASTETPVLRAGLGRWDFVRRRCSAKPSKVRSMGHGTRRSTARSPAYQNNPITGFADDPCRSLTAADLELIESVLGRCIGSIPPAALRDMTHHETRLRWSRGAGIRRAAGTGSRFPNSRCSQFFATRCRDHLEPMFDPDRLAVADP